MRLAILAASLFASCAPALLAYSVSPSATFLNQAIAVVGWGIFLSFILNTLNLAGGQWRPELDFGLWTLFLALVLLALMAIGSGFFRRLPPPLALSNALMLFAALGTGMAGMVLANAGRRVAAFQAVACGVAVAGALMAIISVVQVFFPEWADGKWVAASAMEGRATGNLRQPNHLGSLLLWAVVAMVALRELWHQPGARHLSGMRAVPGFITTSVPLWLAIAGMVLGIVLSASRTAALGLLVLAAWGLLDRGLSRSGRLALLATPLFYAVIWFALTAWADATGHAFGGAVRFSGQGDVSSSRFGVWANTLTLINRHPWTGVGWGGFNFAWSLTPFPHRPVAFFDHTHNLILQLAVELGVPMALLVLGLLGWAFWRLILAAWRAAPGAQAVVLRGIGVMLLLIALHSQLEYPLWYAYFLLPTAFMWGLGLGEVSDLGEPDASPAEPTRANLPKRVAGMPHLFAATRLRWTLRMGALLMVVVGVAAVLDYWRVVVIFAPPAGAAPLAERIERGERSFLFSHHAYYAAATTAAAPEHAKQSAFQVATHHLLDTRLMIAWARALNAQGDGERARHLAERLREFHNPNSDTFFEPCLQQPTPTEPLPFQCLAPTHAMDWRDFE